MLIYHLCADQGVEAEYLTRFGRVVRLGLEPVDRNDSEAVGGDVRQPPLKPGADLALAHPPCGRWNDLNKIHGNSELFPNLIPACRRACRRLARDYIIENVPAAPLVDPVVLDGPMFGLPITKERAFETSFHVPQPVRRAPLLDSVDHFGRYSRSRRWWEAVMGVEHYYPIDSLVTAGMPRAYIEYLLRWYFEWIDGDPREYADRDVWTARP